MPQSIDAVLEDLESSELSETDEDSFEDEYEDQCSSTKDNSYAKCVA